MRKKFTKLMAALALLLFMTPAMVGWGQAWEKATSIQVGDVVVLVTENSNNSTTKMELTSFSTTSTVYGIGTNYTSTPAGTYTFEVVAGKSDGTFAFKHESSYLYWTSGNSLNVNSTLSNNTSWIVSIDETNSKATIKNAADNARQIWWNVSSPRFACYTGKTEGNSYFITTLYKQVGGTSTVATPTFDPAEGTYASAQNVTISCTTQDATIYYTTNGDMPTDASTAYSGAISVSETTTIKAIAYAGTDHGEVATATYNIVTPLTTMQQVYEDAVANTSAHDVYITFNNWVITGTNGSSPNQFYLTDANNTYGCVIYGSGSGFVQGNTLSGTVRCKLQYYGSSYQFAEITSLTTSTDGLTVGTGGSVTPVVTTIDALNSAQVGTVIKLNDLTYNGTVLTDQDDNVINTSNYMYTASLTSGLTYNVTGVYTLGYLSNNTYKRINPRSAADIEEVVITTPFFNADNVSIASDATSGEIAYTLNNPVAGGSLTATTTSEWLTLGNDFTSPIAFTCTANTETTPRTAIVTLTYAYNRATVTKDVTVTQAGYEAPHVTWDLGIASYDEVTDPDLVTWSSNYATMTNSTGTSSTSASNYLGGDANNRTSSRFYKNNVWTLTPAAGYAITSVVLTSTSENYANAFAGSTWTNASASVDGTTVTVIPEDGTTAMSAIISGTCGFTGVTVYYVEDNSPSITVTPAESTESNEYHTGELEITYVNISDIDDWATVIKWCDADGQIVEGTPYPWLSADVEYAAGFGDDNDIIVSFIIEQNFGPERTAYFKVWAYEGGNEQNQVYSNLVTITQVAGAMPSITVTPATIDAPAEGVNGTLAITYENIPDLISFDIQFCDANGNELEGDDPDWIYAAITEPTGDEGYTVSYNIDANDSEARTAYFKVYTDEVYSNLVTITQAEYVAPISGNKYVKVTSTSDLTNGQYLIVYEGGGLAFDGSLETLDAVGNTIEVTINNNEIAATNATIAAEFTVNNGTIKSASGYYIGQDSDANGMKTSTTEAYVNTITIDEDGNAVVLASGGAYLRYNANSGQVRFRYYKSASYTGQNAIQLYKRIYSLTITGFGENTNPGGYHLIASPIKGNVNPEDVTNMLSNTFDLYRFNQNAESEWENWKKEESNHYHFSLEAGRGYLYANSNTIDLVFTGTAYDGDGKVTLTKTEGAEFAGWNLVGNPFAKPAYIDIVSEERPFYTMNDAGTIFEPVTSGSIEAMEGIFVIAEEDGEEMTFTTTEPTNQGKGFTLNLSNGYNIIDRAIVRFNKGRQLPKFQLFKNSTKVYIPMDGQDYAVVRAEEMGAMPVNFKAESNGTYTLSLSSENVEFAYLHLIDNITGNDIDLLQTPSYSFEAKTTDYESRFKLVFATGDNSNEDNFAFFSNGSFVINNEGNATLQVIDITGRILKSESINGCANVNVNAANGVYMLRLVNGDNVKVQKVVVK